MHRKIIFELIFNQIIKSGYFVCISYKICYLLLNFERQTLLLDYVVIIHNG